MENMDENNTVSTGAEAAGEAAAVEKPEEVVEDTAFDEGWGEETPAAETPGEIGEAAPAGDAGQGTAEDAAQNTPGKAEEGTGTAPGQDPPPDKPPEAATAAPPPAETPAAGDQTGQQGHGVSALEQELEGFGGMTVVRDTMGVMQELAKASGMTMEQFLISTHAAMIARRDKVSPEVAAERAKAERLERANAAQRQQEDAKKAEEERLNRDFAAFCRAYPSVDPKSIPREVWDSVRGGQSLLAAYAVYDAKTARAEAQRAREELAAEKQNAANREKAAPPASTAGAASSANDAFEEGWEEE